ETFLSSSVASGSGIEKVIFLAAVPIQPYYHKLSSMTISLASGLDDLLAEDVDHAIERERSEFERLTAGAPDGLVLFGAGNMGRTVAGKLRALGTPPMAFADNNPAVWGRSIDGVPVFSPADATARYGRSAAFLITIWGVGSRDRM